MSAIGRLVEVVQQADTYKQQQLAAMWPELAEAVAGIIEGMTDQDAPREWWPQHAEDAEPEGNADACASALLNTDPLAREMFVEAPARELLGDLDNWKPTGIIQTPGRRDASGTT